MSLITMLRELQNGKVFSVVAMAPLISENASHEPSQGSYSDRCFNGFLRRHGFSHHYTGEAPLWEIVRDFDLMAMYRTLYNLGVLERQKLG